MVRVTWDDQGTRTFHTGIDRGMLYYTDGTKFAVWSGLASVTDSSQGGSATPVFVDARKIRNTISNEIFQGAIEAFYPPPEFAPCAGQVQVSPGLYAPNQPKIPFHFSYRTLVGDDEAGSFANYKLHLLYNVMAQNTDYTRTTINASGGGITHSWNIFTVPVFPKSYRPTAHFVFDTRYVQSFAMLTIENLLYGDASSDPRMPSLDEVLSLLTGFFDVKWWNLTGLTDFPFSAEVGDMGVDFSDDEMYGDGIINTGAYWWDITNGDFPPEARIGDWGIDSSTGQVWQFTG
jgi:hypothetical protein